MLVARESPTGSAAGNKLTLYAFDATMGRFVASIYDDPKLSTVEAVPIAAHEPPRWYRSTLTPELHRGYFVCLNGYLAEGLPHGRIAAKLTRVRVLTLNAATQRETILGEAPMEEDGSFYIAVPPDKPVRFEVLDAAGRAQEAAQRAAQFAAQEAAQHAAQEAAQERARMAAELAAQQAAEQATPRSWPRNRHKLLSWPPSRHKLPSKPHNKRKQRSKPRNKQYGNRRRRIVILYRPHTANLHHRPRLCPCRKLKLPSHARPGCPPISAKSPAAPPG